MMQNIDMQSVRRKKRRIVKRSISHFHPNSKYADEPKNSLIVKKGFRSNKVMIPSTYLSSKGKNLSRQKLKYYEEKEEDEEEQEEEEEEEEEEAENEVKEEEEEDFEIEEEEEEEEEEEQVYNDSTTASSRILFHPHIEVPLFTSTISQKDYIIGNDGHAYGFTPEAIVYTTEGYYDANNDVLVATPENVAEDQHHDHDHYISSNHRRNANHRYYPTDAVLNRKYIQTSKKSQHGRTPVFVQKQTIHSRKPILHHLDHKTYSKKIEHKDLDDDDDYNIRTRSYEAIDHSPINSKLKRMDENYWRNIILEEMQESLSECCEKCKESTLTNLSKRLKDIQTNLAAHLDDHFDKLSNSVTNNQHKFTSKPSLPQEKTINFQLDENLCDLKKITLKITEKKPCDHNPNKDKFVAEHSTNIAAVDSPPAQLFLPISTKSQLKNYRKNDDNSRIVQRQEQHHQNDAHHKYESQHRHSSQSGQYENLHSNHREEEMFENEQIERSDLPSNRPQRRRNKFFRSKTN